MTRPAFANLYAIAGRFISVHCDDEELANTFRHYFENWSIAPVSVAPTRRVDAIILVTGSGEFLPAPSHLEPFEGADGSIGGADASDYFLESDGSIIRANNLHPPLVEVRLENNSRAREPETLARLISNVAMTALRRCGLFELHAAGVIRNGKGVLVIGPSGSGKSTLATQMAAAGWQYLSDDKLLLYEKNENVEAHALRRVFSLNNEALSLSGLARFQAVATLTPHLDPSKKSFDPQAVFPDRFVSTCVPTTLFFTQITNQPSSSTQPLSQNETMARLLRMCPWACYDKPVARTHVGVLARLARQASGYELLAGTDLLSDAKFAGDYLARES